MSAAGKPVEQPSGDESDAVEKLDGEYYDLHHPSRKLDLRLRGRTLRSVLGWGGR